MSARWDTMGSYIPALFQYLARGLFLSNGALGFLSPNAPLRYLFYILLDALSAFQHV